MLEKEVTKKIYVADDNKEECEKYETFVKEILSRIEYFCISYLPDLTETGLFQQKLYVAVYSNNHYHEEIAFNWAIKTCGYLGHGVQGYGFQPNFSLSKSNRIDFDECKPIKWGNTDVKSERLFLSPIEVDGFPENINYMREWGFK